VPAADGQYLPRARHDGVVSGRPQDVAIRPTAMDGVLGAVVRVRKSRRWEARRTCLPNRRPDRWVELLTHAQRPFPGRENVVW